jgi:hypothetical protein
MQHADISERGHSYVLLDRAEFAWFRIPFQSPSFVYPRPGFKIVNRLDCLFQRDKFYRQRNTDKRQKEVLVSSRGPQRFLREVFHSIMLHLSSSSLSTDKQPSCTKSIYVCLECVNCPDTLTAVNYGQT